VLYRRLDMTRVNVIEPASPATIPTTVNVRRCGERARRYCQPGRRRPTLTDVVRTLAHEV
jgi:hypothetical protein